MARFARFDLIRPQLNSGVRPQQGSPLTTKQVIAVLVALALHGSGLAAQTRAELDGADSRRRCLLPDTTSAREEHAVQCAKWFVASQGYTHALPVKDTVLVAPEGVEWNRGAQARLAQRRGSLEPEPLGVCVRPDGGFAVVFWMRGRRYARYVTMNDRYGSLRVEHKNFPPSVVTGRLNGCHPYQPASDHRHQ